MTRLLLSKKRSNRWNKVIISFWVYRQNFAIILIVDNIIIINQVLHRCLCINNGVLITHNFIHCLHVFNVKKLFENKRDCVLIFVFTASNGTYICYLIVHINNLTIFLALSIRNKFNHVGT